jgi:hypothetical protein
LFGTDGGSDDVQLEIDGTKLNTTASFVTISFLSWGNIGFPTFFPLVPIRAGCFFYYGLYL